jgi:hypothetical protein
MGGLLGGGDAQAITDDTRERQVSIDEAKATDIRDVNRDLARLASEAAKLGVRARRAQVVADEAHAIAREARLKWHQAWEAAGPANGEHAEAPPEHAADEQRGSDHDTGRG